MSEENAAISAVTVKLPPFWPEDPEIWIQHIEAQFHLRNITVDATKFYHVVAALDQQTARRIRDTIRSATEGERYTALKKRLLDTYGLNESERANRLLNLRGLGDKKPSELMDEMLALAEGHSTCFLFKQLFINQLPEMLQIQMATVVFEEPRAFALEADKFWRAKSALDFLDSSKVNRLDTRVPSQQTSVAQVEKKSLRHKCISPKQDGLCFYHARLGTNAHKCVKPCNFQGNCKADRQ